MPLLDRDFIAQSLIIVSVCIGAWMMAVKPKVQELGELENTIEQVSNSSAPLNQGAIEGMVARIQPMHERLAQVQQFNRVADDSSGLYGAVMDAADANQVQVHSLRPGDSGKTAPDSLVTSKRIEISVQGAYENVAAFLESICNMEAFMRPVSVQITPAQIDARQLVAAEFSCEVLQFKVADALAEMGGISNAQP